MEQEIKTSEIIAPDYIDNQMEKAREVSKSAKGKILASCTEDRNKHRQDILNLKKSVY